MTTQNILLDSDIRDWVVLPLFVIMVAAGLLRVQIGNLLKPEPKSMPKLQQRSQNAIRAVSSLKGGSVHFLSTSKIEARYAAYPEILHDQAEWCETYVEDQEKLKEQELANPGSTELAHQKSKEGESDDGLPNPMAAMDGMKGNMAFMVQNMVMMQAINHFFSGFILLKIPFSLTLGFKQMFQKGLEISALDTSYVSSVSWYFLVMFGLRGFFRLVIGNPSQETMETQVLWGKLGKKPGGGAPGGDSDDTFIKQLTTEAENLEMMYPKHFKSNLDQVEKRLLGNKYPKRKQQTLKTDFFLHNKGAKKGASSSSATDTSSKKKS
jgi:ER membrane protein complex subunit 3